MSRPRKRRARRARSDAPALSGRRCLINPYPPVAVLSEDQVESEIGMRVLGREARERYRAALGPSFSKRLLSDYRQPTIGPAVEEALRDYVARRKHELSKGTEDTGE